jgi:galactokinase
LDGISLFRTPKLLPPQDGIVDDASSMVSELRARSLQARKAVRDDLNTLDATGELLDQNQAKLDRNNERLKKQIEQMRASKCVTWVLVLLVCLMFVATYLLMKLFPKPKRA